MVTPMSAYHDGQRKMQDAFDSRRIADRLEQHSRTPSDLRVAEERLSEVATSSGALLPTVAVR
jgi:hypothetical protein